VNDREELAERFEAERPQMRRVAYRLLGTLDEADDAVQEAWLRLSRSDASGIENLGAWLTTVVSRVCLNMLQARRARAETYVGSWLPEPIVTIDEAPTPEEEVLIADSVGLALLIALETLIPSERLALVLHDTFGVSFDEIARILGRSPAAARQLASRARHRIRGTPPLTDADATEQRRLVDAFFAASRAGDLATLIRILDPEVVLRCDFGPDNPSAQPAMRGANTVARGALTAARSGRTVRPALVNGAPGAVIEENGLPHAVVAFTISDGRITEIHLILDPHKLARIGPRHEEAI
jgi:RNA polymerase sigma factor (sigma-70 family)